MTLTVSSIPRLFTHLLKDLRENVASYHHAITDDLPFKSMHRSCLEDAYLACQVFQEHFTTDELTQFSDLEKRKDQYTHGRRFLCITSDDCTDMKPLSIQDATKSIQLSLNKRNHRIVMEQVKSCVDKMDHEDLEDKIKSGQLKPLITKQELKDMCCNDRDLTELQAFVRSNYTDLDLYFKMIDQWGDNLYQKYLLWAYPFDLDEVLPYFKHYTETYQQSMSGYDFSDLISKAKVNPVYRDYLLYDYGQKQRGLRVVCDDWRGLRLDPDLLKRYYDLYMQYRTGKDYHPDLFSFDPKHARDATRETITLAFVSSMLYYINQAKCSTKELREMFDYLFNLIGMNNPTCDQIKHLCIEQKLFECAGGYDIPVGLFQAGYIHLSYTEFETMIKDFMTGISRDKTGQINIYSDQKQFNRCILRAYIETHNGTRSPNVKDRSPDDNEAHSQYVYDLYHVFLHQQPVPFWKESNI